MTNVSVCLSAGIHVSPGERVQSLPSIFRGLARSFFGSVAIRYVGLLPVLWMT